MKPSAKAFWIKWLKRAAWLPAMLIFMVLVMEVVYRNQWIDTYRRELNALNPAAPAHPRKKVLVMGDSFTAATNSWVHGLRQRHPEDQIINSAVPGTTILQANLMLQRRLDEFEPELLIYQVYAGNDLFDLRYPLNWENIGWFRNLYWATANHLRGVSWLNYALGQFKRSVSLPDFEQGKVVEGNFDPTKFSERERLYLQAEPAMISDQVMLQGGRAADMEKYLVLMKEFLGTAVAAGCRVIVVVIPHCLQTHPRYLVNMQQVGIGPVDALAIQRPDYPFFQQIKALETKDVSVINLLPDLQDHEQQAQPMYYLHDTHLNDAGQQVLMDVVDAVY